MHVGLLSPHYDVLDEGLRGQITTFVIFFISFIL